MICERFMNKSVLVSIDWLCKVYEEPGGIPKAGVVLLYTYKDTGVFINILMMT
jgi:hypothetical protein